MDKKTYFTSDLHLGHTNVIKFDRRPFTSIEEHDEQIITNIQSLLKPWDDLYILGDVAYKVGKKAQLENYFDRINVCNLFFIRGNHDHRDTRKLFEKYGTYLGEQMLVEVDWDKGSQEIVLNHYPMRSWNKSHYGETWHLYGHHHGSLLDGPFHDWGKSMDVGINTNNYMPYSMQEIYDRIGEKEPFELLGDHHKMRTKEEKI